MEGNDYVNLLCVRINSDKERIEKRQWDKIEVDCFNLADFWNQFGSAVQALSNEVTKICFATGQKPFPSRADVDSMLTDLTQFYTVMRDLYLVLPDEVGATVYDAVTSAHVKILVALIAVVRSLSDISEQGAKERLSLTGTLWDACNAVESLPRDNLLAVLSVIEDESSLAKDAQDELSATMDEDEDAAEYAAGGMASEDVWTDEERELARRAMGLVKVTEMCMKRVRKAVISTGNCDSALFCTQLDTLASLVKTVSPALDNFVSELYHPVNVPVVMEMATKLAEVLKSLISCVQNTHLGPAIEKDRNKILMFINHNHNKVNQSLTNPVPQLNNLHL